LDRSKVLSETQAGFGDVIHRMAMIGLGFPALDECAL
jgi:hypothetical protein